MVKYVCINCGKVWYTANTSANQKCDDCGALIKECSESENKIIFKKSNNKM